MFVAIHSFLCDCLSKILNIPSTSVLTTKTEFEKSMSICKYRTSSKQSKNAFIFKIKKVDFN